MIEASPLRRLGDAKEVAAKIVWLVAASTNLRSNEYALERRHAIKAPESC
jgi:hypothetical protein